MNFNNMFNKGPKAPVSGARQEMNKASGMESEARKYIIETQSEIEGDLDFINANKEKTITDPEKQSLFEKAMMQIAVLADKVGIKDVDDLVTKSSFAAVGVGGAQIIIGILEKMQHMDLSAENIATRGFQTLAAGAIVLTYEHIKETWNEVIEKKHN